jgi:hypothetical protein
MRRDFVRAEREFSRTANTAGVKLLSDMLLTKRKRTRSRLLGRVKARTAAELPAAASADLALDHHRQLAVVDAVEWAAERWASRELAPPGAPDPRPAHAARLIAALGYLDARFARLDPSFVTEVIDGVANPAQTEHAAPRLDAKAAAALLTVEVGAFRR